ncbi:MAG: POTRA domain-containing protein, partial [Terriglobales bacterium]
MAPTGARAAADLPLKSVVIDGSTVYSQAELFAAYRDQLGEPVSRDGVRAIAVAVADIYRNGGYARPELKLDQVLVANGVLRFQVHEPYVSRVTIGGEPGRHRETIERIADGLYQSRPLRRDAI